jgi:hypothetical protein
MSGEHLDLYAPAASPAKAASPKAPTRFLGVHFACCDAYLRVYLNADQSAYVGHCPKCARRVRFAVGPGGSDARFFTAT